MPGFTDDFLDEVRARNDIVDVVSGYVHLEKRGSNYFGLCPFHSEKTPSFSVSPGKQMYYCFGCHEGGNVITFLMNIEHYTFREAVEKLAERCGMDIPQDAYGESSKKERDRKDKLREINKASANYYYLQLKGSRGKAGRDYFEKRKLSDETILHFGLGYSLPYSDDLYRFLKSKGYQDDLLKDCGLVVFDERRGGHDKFWNRVMFPILDANGQVIGFGGRVLGDGQPKYLNSPETEIFNKRKNLYGLYFARRSREKEMILCEGYMDVISLHQAGFTNAVASLGTALTQEHCKLLSRYTKQVLLCYDSDKAGVSAALRAAPMLKEAGITSKVIHMDPFKDPDEFIKNLGAEEFRKRMQDAQNSFLFEIDQLQKEYDMGDPDGRTGFVQELSSRLTRFRDEVERNNYIDAVCERYHLEQGSLRRETNAIGEKKEEQRMRNVRFSASSPRMENREEGQRQRQKKSGLSRTQDLLLTWLCEEPKLYPVVRSYLSPEDFDGGLYREAAEMFFEQMENGQDDPAKIIATYQDPEDQKEVSGMFYSDAYETVTPDTRDKAMRESILKMKESSLERYRREHSGDQDFLSTTLKRQKELQELRRRKILQ